MRKLLGIAMILVCMQAAAGPEPHREMPLPATFVGVLPCADCPGIEYRLALFADGAYYLRTTHQAREDGQLDDIGTWLRSSDGEILALHGGREAPVMFAIAGPDRLDKLDLEGRPIVSELNHSLSRTRGQDPLEPSLHMRGMFSYFADSAVFEECLTGRRMPVTMEADYLRLEQAYLQARREPGEALLANLRGRIVERVNMEGPARPSVIVEEFLGIWPREGCGARFSAAEFYETYWKLTQLDGQPVFVGERQREAHMIFRAGEPPSVSGSTGCNRFTGGFERDGEALRFSRFAGTMMACPDTMEQESAFHRAMDAVRGWRIIGQHLELSDAEGRLRARLEAVYLR
jgi:copper homeostasis protein (lipoprotein)